MATPDDYVVTLALITYLIWLIAFAIALPAPALGAVRGGWRGFALACTAPLGGVLSICLVWSAMIALESEYCNGSDTAIMSVMAGTGAAGLLLVAIGWRAALVRREPKLPDLNRCVRCSYDLRGINRYPTAEFMICPECGALSFVPPI